MKLTEGDRIKNIHNGKEYIVVKTEIVDGNYVTELDDGTRFNQDYEHHYRIAK